MKVFNESNDVVMFDTDETLLTRFFQPEDMDKTVELKANGTSYKLLPVQFHVERLKLFKERGFIVIVWSAGGANHAKQVVEALSLTNYVDICLTKPKFYFDDEDANHWMLRMT